METYDLIILGTGSGTNYIDSIIELKPDIRIAVIDKDDPGGICLTRGCIPSKLLIYPAELIRIIGTAGKFGINVTLNNIDFNYIMDRMRTLITGDIESIRSGLSSNRNIDYYQDIAQFISPYTLKVGEKTITSKMIFLCTGSKPIIPEVNGLEETGYLTSDTVLKMTGLPPSIAIIGGGYIAAEYGHFFSSMGSKVTILGRKEDFISGEEHEISILAKREMSRYMNIHTGHDVIEVHGTVDGMKKVIALHDGNRVSIDADAILVATGRGPNTDILHPEKGGIRTGEKGWIEVNEYLKTSQPGVWAFGDADGKYPFKHVANHESTVVFHNAILKKRRKVDYHAVPHAIFSHPEIAGVGLSEKEALEKFKEEGVLIGFKQYENTAKGKAMESKDYFVKIILEKSTSRILGAHIIGPQASILIQEIVNTMYSEDASASSIINGMHIHPALSEVVQRAFHSTMAPAHYHHLLGHLGLKSL